ncbi:hypothetical protein LCGC14_1489110 [marine sediment metagenome]|uniref:Uncharacterized protein n=1 Tax=marine sediment metagenome TaxID=412755 RepID=A0A0F9J7V1_9ZZZZ
MPQEGNVQVVVPTVSVEAGTAKGFVVELGAKGEAVALLGLHVGIEEFLPSGEFVVFVALSSNPGHLLTPPATSAARAGDKALYGATLLTGREVLDTSGGRTYTIPSISTPLYGLIRPRRQVLIVFFVNPGVLPKIRVEIYYKPLSLGKIELDALNLKYGKYRRGA